MRKNKITLKRGPNGWATHWSGPKAEWWSDRCGTVVIPLRRSLAFENDAQKVLKRVRMANPDVEVELDAQ